MLNAKRFLYSLVLTALTTAGCYLIALWSFEGNLYYMAQLIPVFLVGYAFMAWILYIREDGFSPFKRKGPRVDTLGHSQHDEDENKQDVIVVDSKENGLKVKDGLVQRRETEDEERESKGFWNTSKFVFLWSALQLAIVAGILYHVYDIGARFA